MAERLTLTLNVDKEAMRAAGINPDTLEGKAAVVELVLEALHVFGDAHSEELSDQELAVIEALLAEARK